LAKLLIIWHTDYGLRSSPHGRSRRRKSCRHFSQSLELAQLFIFPSEFSSRVWKSSRDGGRGIGKSNSLEWRIMKRIWKFLRYIWDAWIPHRNPDLGPDVMVGCRTRNEKDNKILDEWLEEYKGKITPEALEEYRRRVIKSVER
jgi:hypothetical protein